MPWDSSPPLSITLKCLRVLWQKPSVVSGSYTVMWNSSPLIWFNFICTVGWLSLVLHSFRHSTLWHFRITVVEDFSTLHFPTLETPKRSLSSLTPSPIFHRCDKRLWLLAEPNHVSHFIFSTIRHSCDQVSRHSMSQSLKWSLVALALSSISHRCDQWLWP